MSDVGGEPQRVAGERDTSPVGRAFSVQSRVSNLLALVLMSALGLGSLVWYYANAMTRQTRAKASAVAASTSRAQGEMPLPSLGRIGSPMVPPVFDPLASVPPAPGSQTAQTLAEIPVTSAAPVIAGNAIPPKDAEEVAMERQLSGAVFSPQGAPAAVAAAHADSKSGADAMPGTAPGDLSTLLRPTASPAVRAHILPAQRLLLPKGAFIDCTLETAIDSTLPGMTTCVMATDAFGVDGKVVLLERGTKLIGETRGQVAQGAARIFVLWSEARSPSGVVVPLDSPSADELGRSGLPGEVDRHFWQRFGAAMLVSVIDGAVQAAAQSSHGGNVILNPSSSQDVLTEILRNTIDIPPTVTKHNGDRIQVFVARDVDFRSVYELRSAAGR